MKSFGHKQTLFCSILEFGKGSKILKLSKELGTLGGTIFLGRGTVRNEWLNRLGVHETRKEIFITIVDDELEEILYDRVTKQFNLNKPHHGIAFSMPLNYYAHGSKNISNRDKKGGNNMDYEAIFVISDKSDEDEILEAAKLGGSTGGTIIHARGSGTSEKAKLFDIEIEPEKIVVLILSKVEKTETIVNSIKERLNIKEPSKGIIFVMDVSKAIGLYQK